jgi:hypothetical protein
MTAHKELILQLEHLFTITLDQTKSRSQQLRAQETIALKLAEHGRVIRKKYKNELIPVVKEVIMVNISDISEWPENNK